MLDIKFIRQNPEKIAEAAKNKNINFDVHKLIAVDERRRHLMTEFESLRAGQNKRSTSKPTPEEVEALRAVKDKIKLIEEELRIIEKEFNELMVQVPNIPSEDTPFGKNETENVEVFKTAIPKFKFTPKDHIQIATELDLIDFDRGTKVAGYRGYYLKNEGALLAMALMMFAVEKMVKKGYLPMIPPTLVKGNALFGSGYFKGTEYNGDVDEIYQVASSDREASGEKSSEQKFLVGTAEPSLLGYYSDETLKEEDLPLKLCGFSQCYRSEIGSYGKDTKGLYRVHEFMKVEQVVISKAITEDSDKLQQEMVGITKEIHKDLGIPYRVIQICTGDMSAGKYKQFDYEAWLPGSNRWAETGSASNFLDWQARRLNIKYIAKDGERKFAYLLNNTALPTPRPLIAILENFQTKKGTVVIPKVLRKYMNGLKEIKRK
jgi:seryl-tRNA synthetase